MKYIKRINEHKSDNILSGLLDKTFNFRYTGIEMGNKEDTTEGLITDEQEQPFYTEEIRNMDVVFETRIKGYYVAEEAYNGNLIVILTEPVNTDEVTNYILENGIRREGQLKGDKTYGLSYQILCTREADPIMTGKFQGCRFHKKEDLETFMELFNLIYISQDNNAIASMITKLNDAPKTQVKDGAITKAIKDNYGDMEGFRDSIKNLSKIVHKL